MAAEAGRSARNGATGAALAVTSPAGGTGVERDGTADNVGADLGWRHMTIAGAGIGDTFSGRMPQQGKSDTEENHDDHGADERNAGEMQ